MFLARHPLAGFLLFSHGWTWAWWALAGIIAYRQGGTVWAQPAATLFIIGGAGVFVGALVMTAAVSGRAGLGDLLWRCVDVRRIGAAWWWLVLGFFPLLTVLAAAVAAALGLDADLDPGNVARRAADPLAFIALLLFILLIGPLPEEVGWRGYLTDRLQQRVSAFNASLLVALAWWSWHLPLGWLPGYFDAFDSAGAAPWRQLASLLVISVLYTWIYVNTGRSVLAVIVFHFLGNLTGQLLLPSDDVRHVRIGLELAVALGVLGWWGPQRLRRSPADPAFAPTRAD